MTTFLEQLETPVPVVDLDRMAMNLDRMAAYATLHGLQLRPHVKTHKSPRIAAEQLRHGAVGLTCATLREAEVMSEVCDDLLVAYPPVGAARLERLARLPADIRVGVAADDAAALPALSLAAKLGRRQFDVYVEADVGMHRIGVANPEKAITLAKAIADSSNLNFGGLLFYPGHIRQDVKDQTAALAALGVDIARYTDALRDASLPVRVVSGGSTPAAWRFHEVPGVTEVRLGPVGGTIGAMLASAFGCDSSPDSLHAAIAADPEAALKLATVESDNKVKLQGMMISHADNELAASTAAIQADVDDRKSAREREVAVKDSTPAALGWLVVGASVALGAAVVTGYVSKDPALAGISGTVIGYVFGEAKQVLAYFFGSSTSAARTTELLASSTPGK